MVLKQFGLGVALTALAFSVAATPQYTGDTQASGELELSHGFGYYIWNDAASPSDWRIRWTGDGAEGEIASWFGSIGFVNESLGSYSEISFESNHNSIGESAPDLSGTDLAGVSNLEWIAYTNTTGGYDGLNFSIGSNYELMELKLGSSLFSDLGQYTTLSDPGIVGSYIYVGPGYETPNVLINENGRQQFEIAVPEPATLALLGIGLLGLGAARSRSQS